MKKISIVWLRRNLRLEDNKPFAEALKSSKKIIPIFIFDTTILQNFSNPLDRRLSFLANAIYNLNSELQELEGNLLVLYGNSVEIIPKLIEKLNIQTIYADEEYDPENIIRDQKIISHLEFNGKSKLELVCDHLLLKPGSIVTHKKQYYMRYNPYNTAFKQYLRKNCSCIERSNYRLDHRLVSLESIDLSSLNLKIINLNHGASEILNQIGYTYQKDNIWQPIKAKNILNNFIQNNIISYRTNNTNQNLLYLNNSSTISPYLRFGLVSIRECFSKAIAADSKALITDEAIGKTEKEKGWIDGLIHREFYASLLFRFPNTVSEEFQDKYRNNIPWKKDLEIYCKFTEGKTGYPMIDASIKQLLRDGWMHNLARTIVANFFTKYLLLDWRLGEHFFSQYLMDYELASNVGSWQWAASCGTDMEHFIRMFCPFAQGRKFDHEAKYIKKYLPNLEHVSAKVIHNVHFSKKYPNYLTPIIDYQLSKDKSSNFFKQIKKLKNQHQTLLSK